MNDGIEKENDSNDEDNDINNNGKRNMILYIYEQGQYKM